VKHLRSGKVIDLAVTNIPKSEGTEPIAKRRARTGATILIAVYLLGAGLANFIQSDRLPQDYLAELVTGKECNTLAAIKDKGPLCRESFNPPIYEKPIYCYRTLGQVKCYEEPDPYGPTTRRVR
jgi:hypothetical protein